MREAPGRHDVPQGLQVTDVDGMSAVEEAGIQRNDIILELIW